MIKITVQGIHVTRKPFIYYISRLSACNHRAYKITLCSIPSISLRMPYGCVLDDCISIYIIFYYCLLWRNGVCAKEYDISLIVSSPSSFKVVSRRWRRCAFSSRLNPSNRRPQLRDGLGTGFVSYIYRNVLLYIYIYICNK